MKINIHQGKRYTFPTHVNDMLLPRENAEAMEAFLVIIEPGQSTHFHSHSDTEQLFYVLSGEGKGVLHFRENDIRTMEMCPEDILFVPRNIRHQIFCTSVAEPLRYPFGRPWEEPTWDDHYRAVLQLQRNCPPQGCSR
jgi:quercetin dioxygenase-like cupin family protein